MHHLPWVRDHLDVMNDAMQRRGEAFDCERFQTLDAERKAAQMALEAMQNERNVQSKAMGKKKAAGEPMEVLRAELAELNQRMHAQKEALNAVQTTLNGWLMSLPNVPDADVPDGRDEQDNVTVGTWGEVPDVDAQDLPDHVDVGTPLGLDMDAGAQLSGSRFAVMTGFVAKLQRVLIQWMLDVHTQQHGYTECYVPTLVHEAAMVGSGQFPKFKDDAFAAQDGFYLIPTAEVPLVNLLAGRRFTEDMLPIRWVAHTSCFRREAGSYGRDTRGLVRTHQFEKVELVQCVHPNQSDEALANMVDHASSLLKALALPHRVVTLCTGDLGFSAAKTYDLEVWLPSQGTYREISSCSNCRGFQAQRMGARMTDADGRKQPVHTLNASGLALSRTMVAVLEHYRQPDGSVAVPDVLRPYWDRRVDHHNTP